MIDVLYFAWVRERIGLPKERIDTNAATVADLIEELRAREDRYLAAFADLRFCNNQFGLKYRRQNEVFLRISRRER